MQWFQQGIEKCWCPSEWFLIQHCMVYKIVNWALESPHDWPLEDVILVSRDHFQRLIKMGVMDNRNVISQYLVTCHMDISYHNWGHSAKGRIASTIIENGNFAENYKGNVLWKKLKSSKADARVQTFWVLCMNWHTECSVYIIFFLFLIFINLLCSQSSAMDHLRRVHSSSQRRQTCILWRMQMWTWHHWPAARLCPPIWGAPQWRVSSGSGWGWGSGAVDSVRHQRKMCSTKHFSF